MSKCPECNSWIHPGKSYNEKTFYCPNCGIELFEEKRSAFWGRVRLLFAWLGIPGILVLIGAEGLPLYLIASIAITYSYFYMSKYRVKPNAKRWGADSPPE